MHVNVVRGVLALGVALCGGSTLILAQGQVNAAAQVHIEAARKAAGTEHKGVFDVTCGYLTPPTQAAAQPAAARTPGPPARDTWFTEPAKVFDNLYFLGQSEYSSWAVVTSQGLIVIDAIFNYSVEDEVVGGMKKLGLDPAQIKYVIVSHGHGDHSGGAKYLQDKFNAHVLLGAADWDLLDRSNGSKPRRDMVATDGQKLTLGDTTITIYATPGHTLGTLSTVFPVTDHGEKHVVASWGGTAFNWLNNGGRGYITPDKPATFWFKSYDESARRFRDIAAKEGADVIIANHTIFDGSKTKLPAVLARKAGDPNPFVVGKEGVLRYLTTVDECAQAGLTKMSQQ